MQIGMYMTPINNHLTGPEIAYILKDSGAKVFFGSEKFAEACAAAREEVELLHRPSASQSAHVDGFRPFAELKQGQPDSLPEERTAGQVMNYTSGTTGKPKGVRRPLADISPDIVATLTTGFLAHVRPRSPRTTTSTSAARRSTTPRCSCSPRRRCTWATRSS